MLSVKGTMRNFITFEHNMTGMEFMSKDTTMVAEMVVEKIIFGSSLFSVCSFVHPIIVKMK